MSIFLFADKFSYEPIELEDSPETWAKLLDDPEVISADDDDPHGKRAASVICGARYFPEVLKSKVRDKEGVDGVECLVLDVDCPDTPTGTAPPEAALRASLEGMRAVVYTSPSHAPEEPRWRVIIPLLTPLPPKKHRALVKLLSDNLVPGYEGCISVSQTGDPCRLGFVGVTKHPEHYKWWRHEGTPLDWTGIALEEEVWVAAPLGGLERSSLWTDRSTALKAALKRYATTGQGMARGQGRTLCLWDAALALWWAWAAEDEDFVLEVLRQINANFSEPEHEDELQRKMHEAHKRAIGERRREQNNGSYGHLREPTNVVSEAAIKAHAKRLSQRQNPELALIGEALKALAKGHTLSEDAQTWRGLVTKCAHEMARAFPSESAERIATFFRPSLSTMKSAGGVLPTEEEIRGYVAARLEGIRKNKEENREKADARVREQIEYVTEGERSTKYTKSEIEAWRENVGLRENNWILVSKRAYFVFRNGTWVGPYTKEEFEAQGYKDLAAASDFVRTQTFNELKQVWTNVPMQKLLHDYGSRCVTRCDLNCERTWFNEEDHTLVLAGPPKRDLQPKFHEEVDQWFRFMCGRKIPANMKVRQTEAATTIASPSVLGDDYDTLCDWLACLTQLDHPCAALYLEGKKNVGKGLFADGTSRIWKTGAIALEDAVLADFNSLLADTPYVWVDEGLPEHVRASVLLRKVIASREFTYKRKYIDAGKMTGCLRMLFTANNLDLFNKTREHLKRADVDALSSRFVHILVRPEAEAYLDSISPRHHAFVESNMLAEHALWLHDKRWAAIKKRGLRFLVNGQNTNVADVVATNSPVTSACCTAICEVLASGKASEWCLVKDSEVWVNANILTRFFSLQMNAEKFSEREVVRAITSISGTSKSFHNQLQNKQMRMRPMRVQSLRAWCENTSVFEWEDVSAGMEKLNTATAVHEQKMADAAAAVKKVVEAAGLKKSNTKVVN